jgi:predicted benzoate:H+ symporter BenE
LNCCAEKTLFTGLITVLEMEEVSALASVAEVTRIQKGISAALIGKGQSKGALVLIIEVTARVPNCTVLTQNIND